jgi:hypothetical protein
MEGEAKLEQKLFRDRRHHMDDRAVVDSAHALPPALITPPPGAHASVQAEGCE